MTRYVSGLEIEALLDNEVSRGLAPKAKICYYASAEYRLSWGENITILRALNDNAVNILGLSIESCDRDKVYGNRWLFETTGRPLLRESASLSPAVTAARLDVTTLTRSPRPSMAWQSMLRHRHPTTLQFEEPITTSSPTDFSTYVSSGAKVLAPYYRTALKYIAEKPWNNSTTVNTPTRTMCLSSTVRATAISSPAAGSQYRLRQAVLPVFTSSHG